ncbi:MAG: hypothetical protein IT183_11445 [Acidobacteria bacterium]|nr:hypothetical protein [Acidobacteriota bacterium]
MKRYLLSIYQPDGPVPPPELLGPVMQKVQALNQELQQAGAWVFAGGLHPPETATVVRVKDGDLLLTDGPYVEGKEHIGGFTVIDAPDLDAAMGWAKRLSQALTLPGHTTGLAVEVRPFQHGG